MSAGGCGESGIKCMCEMQSVCIHGRMVISNYHGLSFGIGNENVCDEER